MYNFHHLGMLCAFWLPQGPTCPSCRQHLRWNTGALVPPMAAVGLLKKKALGWVSVFSVFVFTE